MMMMMMIVVMVMMMMIVEQSVECELAGETEVIGENLPLCPPQIPHALTRARTQAAAVGSLSYGTAF
jgi:hypothetical protein